MNNLLIGAFILLLIALGWSLWRYFALRQAVNNFTRTIQQLDAQAFSPEDLPADFPELEPLSNAIHSLAITQAERRNSESAERDRLEATLNQMTDGVLIVDAFGRIQMANPAANELFSENGSLVGKTVSVALRHHQLIETWRKCQQTHEMQSESVDLSATRKFLQLIAIPDEHASGAILLIQDLTRIRRLETVRRDFISNVSHELRTPLASLKALTETLQEGALDDPAAAHRFLGRILIEVDALTQMAAELLELSRIESGQVLLARKPIQPIQLLNSAADRMKMQADRAGLDVRVECPDNLPLINADMPRLEQVLVNLIHNAVKFTPPGGEVTLSARAEGSNVLFAVRDTGCGIPADDLPRIFERFYRVDRSRAGGGTGLGLSIARHLVEAHSGKIWAESREGEGSIFYLTIPCMHIPENK